MYASSSDSVLAILFNHCFLKTPTILETNSLFTPENQWLASMKCPFSGSKASFSEANLLLVRVNYLIFQD